MRKRTRLQYVKGFKYSHQNNLRKKNPKELFLTQFDLSLNRKMYVRIKIPENTITVIKLVMKTDHQNEKQNF